MTMKIQVVVFWVVTLYGEDGILSHHYMVSYPRRLLLEFFWCFSSS